MRTGDWILATMLSSFPLLGFALGRGDGLSLAGVGILIWAGHRAPVSSGVRHAHRALGVSVALVLLCLLLPRLDADSGLAWLGVGLRLGLVAALLAVWLRGDSADEPRLRFVDRITALSVLGSVGVGLALFAVSDAVALSVVEPVCLMAGVYVIFRRHLLKSEALPVLTRATLAGLAGACLVTFSGAAG